MNNAGDAVFHLPLNDLTSDGRFLDASGRHAAAITKSVELVPDDLFGACALFGGDGSYLEVPDSPELRIEGDMALEAWVSLTADPTDYVAIIAKGPSDRRNYCFWYHKVPYSLKFQRYVGGTAQDCTIPASFVLERNTWYHIAGVLQGTMATVVIHDARGKPLLSEPQKAAWNGAATTGEQPLRLGNAGYYGSHKGKLANVRIYRRALSPEEIADHIRTDLLGTATFRKSHPIDFRTYDDDDSPLICITDQASGARLNVELRNTSAQDIRLIAGPSTQASAENHHFALRFRRGTLSDNAIKSMRLTTGNQAEWNLSVVAPVSAEEEVSAYLLSKDSSKEWRAGDRRVLTLEQVSAAAGSGSRGTQVELVPHPSQVTYASADATPITGSRTQYIHVTSHVGKRNIPLHVSVIPSNRVLNGGKAANRFSIRVTNVSKDPISLTAPAQFVLSFEVQSEEAKDWALTTAKEAESVKVEMQVKLGAPEIEGRRPPGAAAEWELKFPSDARLEPCEHLDIKVRELVSSLPNGSANLYLHYKNIPGHWEGTFVCTMEKGPLFISDNKVGIGLREPKEALDIVGSVNVTDVLNVRSLKVAEPVEPLLAPHYIGLASNWMGVYEMRWWKDALGMIHLAGSISHVTLPENAHDKLIALTNYARMFELPAACAPAFGPRRFLAAYLEFDNAAPCAVPILVQEWFRRADAGGGLYDPFVLVSIEYGSSTELLRNVKGVHCALDGISYLARG